MSPLLIFLLLLNAYILILYALHRSGKLGKNLELAGPLLMWKTQAGKRTIDRLAERYPRFWERWADAAIVTTWTTGLLIFALLLFQVYVVLTRPEQVAASTPPPQYLLGLPGVNPMIPLGYGIVGLAIALIVHEGSHGILARVGRMGVKSLGLLFFIVPVGAFVEPDEKDLERASTRAKNRVFAVGPMANIALAVVSAILFSSIFMSSVAVANDGVGLGVTVVSPDGPAERAGIANGDILVSVDGYEIRSTNDFFEALNGTRAGQVVTLTYLTNGEEVVTSATLADKYEYYEREAPQFNNASFKGDGYLGAGGLPLTVVGSVAGILAHPFQDGPLDSFNLARGGSFFIYISYPFLVLAQGVDIMTDPYRDFLVVQGPLGALPEGAFFVTAYMLYWLFWLNLMLGTFNALPMGPLDGGQMFKATLRERLFRWYRVEHSRLKVEQEAGVPGAQLMGTDAETQTKLERVNRTLKRATWSLGFFILGLILLPILVSYVMNLV